MKNPFAARTKGGNEFAVEIADIERLAELVTSGKLGEYPNLGGNAGMERPIHRVEARLTLYEAMNGAESNYALEARIVPAPNARLAVDPDVFKGQFEVNRNKVSGLTLYSLHSPQLPEGSKIALRVPAANRKGTMSLMQIVNTYKSIGIRTEDGWRYMNGSGLSMLQVMDALDAYATALGLTVNSIYAKARKPSPDSVMKLEF